MKQLLILMLTLPVLSCGNGQELSATCVFDYSITTYLKDEGRRSEPYHRVQSMVILGGQTSQGTLEADGTIRSTNSHKWQNDTARGDNYPAYFGDFGELLTLATFGNTAFGEYPATLQTSTPLSYLVTHVGTCSGAFY